MPWKLVAGQLKQLGFEPGWGKNVGIVRQRLHELLDILEVCRGATAPCRNCTV
jgi:sucrose synthase